MGPWTSRQTISHSVFMVVSMPISVRLACCFGVCFYVLSCVCPQGLLQANHSRAASLSRRQFATHNLDCEIIELSLSMSLSSSPSSSSRSLFSLFLFFFSSALLIHMSIIWIYVMSCVRPDGRPSCVAKR